MNLKLENVFVLTLRLLKFSPMQQDGKAEVFHNKLENSLLKAQL
jgi:hypothetical protein